MSEGRKFINIVFGAIMAIVSGVIYSKADATPLLWFSGMFAGMAVVYLMLLVEDT